jgi:hypothetical protein
LSDDQSSDRRIADRRMADRHPAGSKDETMKLTHVEALGRHGSHH